MNNPNVLTSLRLCAPWCATDRLWHDIEGCVILVLTQDRPPVSRASVNSSGLRNADLGIRCRPSSTIIKIHVLESWPVRDGRHRVSNNPLYRIQAGGEKNLSYLGEFVSLGQVFKLAGMFVSLLINLNRCFSYYYTDNVAPVVCSFKGLSAIIVTLNSSLSATENRYFNSADREARLYSTYLACQSDYSSY